MEYSLNKSSPSFIKFPKDISFEYKLGSYQKFQSSYYPKDIFYFKGKVDIVKFIKSFNEALNYHYIVLGNYKIDSEGNIYIYYDSNKKNHLEKQLLEVEYVNGSMDIKDPKISKYIARDILNQIDDFGFVKSFDETPFGIYKLTVYNDGFVFGVCGTHSFNDTHTMNKFIQTISENYSIKYHDEMNTLSIFNCNSTLNKPSNAKPFYFNTNDIIDKTIKTDRNKCDEFFYSKFGYINKSKVPEFIEKNKVDIYFFNNSIVKLKFNLNHFNQFLSQCTNYKLSKNDLIHAILLKVFTFTHYLKNENTFTLRYISDIRKLFNMGEEYLGSAININKLELNVQEIRESSLIDLAIKSHLHTKKLNKEDFIENLSWYELVTNDNQDASSYACLPSFFSTSVSNWTAFNFNTIKFGNQTPIANKSSDIAAYGVNMITFEYEENIKYYCTSVAIPTDCIDQLINFSNKSKLFKTENILTNNAKI